MRLTKYGHSCVRIEHDGAVLVIDPGAFTDARAAALDGVDAVLITHEHADHLDPDALADALGRRSSVTVHTHEAVLSKLDAVRDVVTTVDSGETFTAAGMTIRAYGGLHAEIHPEIPRVPNLGFLVDGSVYHPGDSFDVPEGATVDTLFVPVSAPWLRVAQSVEFVRAVAPRRAFALHDAVLSDVGGTLTDGLMSKLARCDYARLAPGTSVDAD